MHRDDNAEADKTVMLSVHTQLHDYKRSASYMQKAESCAHAGTRRSKSKVKHVLPDQTPAGNSRLAKESLQV